MTAIAKVTAKGQVTMPKEVRDALHVDSGSLLAWEALPDGSARVRVIQPMDVPYLQALEATLSEWGGARDEEAYRDL